MGFKLVGSYFQNFYEGKMAHTYQKLTYTNIAKYISDSFIKKINNRTQNILK